MADPGLAEHIDPGALEELLGSLRQGDVLDVPKTAVLFSPDMPTYPNETEGIEADEPVMTMEVRQPSQLAVVISQDCDLARPPHTEPYVLIVPLTQVTPTAYQDASRLLSTRYFAYGEIEGHEHKERLAADLRVVTSLEKVALLSPHIARIPCPLSDVERGRLRRWLGRRFGRYPFPDEIQRGVIDPIEDAVAAVRKNEAHRKTHDTVVYHGVAFTPQTTACTLLLLTHPGRRMKAKVAGPEMDALRKRIAEQVMKRTKNSEYSVTVLLHDVDQVRASDLLGRAELQLDVGDEETAG